MRAQLGFLCEVNPALRTSEPFDELSARIFVRSDPRTGDTPRNPMTGAKDSSDFGIAGHVSRCSLILILTAPLRILEDEHAETGSCIRAVLVSLEVVPSPWTVAFRRK